MLIFMHCLLSQHFFFQQQSCDMLPSVWWHFNLPFNTSINQSFKLNYSTNPSMNHNSIQLTFNFRVQWSPPRQVLTLKILSQPAGIEPTVEKGNKTTGYFFNRYVYCIHNMYNISNIKLQRKTYQDLGLQ